MSGYNFGNLSWIIKSIQDLQNSNELPPYDSNDENKVLTVLFDIFDGEYYLGWSSVTAQGSLINSNTCKIINNGNNSSINVSVQKNPANTSNGDYLLPDPLNQTISPYSILGIDSNNTGQGQQKLNFIDFGTIPGQNVNWSLQKVFCISFDGSSCIFFESNDQGSSLIAKDNQGNSFVLSNENLTKTFSSISSGTSIKLFNFFVGASEFDFLNITNEGGNILREITIDIINSVNTLIFNSGITFAGSSLKKDGVTQGVNLSFNQCVFNTEMIINDYIMPVGAGNIGQYLMISNAGQCIWNDVVQNTYNSGSNISIDINKNINLNTSLQNLILVSSVSGNFNTLTIKDITMMNTLYSFPTVVGSLGQILTLGSNDVLQWTTPSAGQVYSAGTNLSLVNDVFSLNDIINLTSNGGLNITSASDLMNLTENFMTLSNLTTGNKTEIYANIITILENNIVKSAIGVTGISSIKISVLDANGNSLYYFPQVFGNDQQVLGISGGVLTWLNQSGGSGISQITSNTSQFLTISQNGSDVNIDFSGYSSSNGNLVINNNTKVISINDYMTLDGLNCQILAVKNISDIILYTLPVSAGSANQVLTWPSSGTQLIWSDIPASSLTFNSNTLQISQNGNSYDIEIGNQTIISTNTSIMNFIKLETQGINLDELIGNFYTVLGNDLVDGSTALQSYFIDSSLNDIYPAFKLDIFGYNMAGLYCFQNHSVTNDNINSFTSTSANFKNGDMMIDINSSRISIVDGINVVNMNANQLSINEIMVSGYVLPVSLPPENQTSVITSINGNTNLVHQNINNLLLRTSIIITNINAVIASNLVTLWDQVTPVTCNFELKRDGDAKYIGFSLVNQMYFPVSNNYFSFQLEDVDMTYWPSDLIAASSLSLNRALGRYQCVFSSNATQPFLINEGEYASEDVKINLFFFRTALNAAVFNLEIKIYYPALVRYPVVLSDTSDVHFNIQGNGWGGGSQNFVYFNQDYDGNDCDYQKFLY